MWELGTASASDPGAWAPTGPLFRWLASSQGDLQAHSIDGRINQLLTRQIIPHGRMSLSSCP